MGGVGKVISRATVDINMHEPGSGPSAADVVQADPETHVVLGLHPIDMRSHVAGPAITCRCAPSDNLALHRALAVAGPGDVIVCDAGGRLDAGYFGELMATDAVRQGVAGLVIFGSIRDSSRIRELGFPVFSIGTNPTTSQKHDEGVPGTVRLRDVPVSDGDIIVADSDAVCVVAASRWERVRMQAREVIEREMVIKSRLESERLWRVLGLDFD